MPTHCTVSDTTLGQVLDPSPVVPPGGTLAQYIENGSKQLSVGVQSYTVTFVTAKVSALYIFDEFVLVNSTDVSPLGLDLEVTSKSTTGFTFNVTNGAPDTVNFSVSWSVRILT